MKCYIHKKTGKIYYVTGQILNSTNSADGQEMILYTNEEGLCFVRERKEFKEKFQQMPIKCCGTCLWWSVYLSRDKELIMECGPSGRPRERTETCDAWEAMVVPEAPNCETKEILQIKE